MSKLKVLIIEDEQSVQKDITGLLKLIPEVEVIDIIETVEKALQVLPNTNADVVLLDIHLKDGTAFDLLGKLGPRYNYHIIFITAHEQYAIKAIKIGALDYLLKPLDLEELKESLAKRHREPLNQKQVEVVVEATNSSNTRLVLRNTSGIHFMSFKELAYCRGEGSYTHFCDDANNSIMVSKPLKEYEDVLPGVDFIRCHQSYIVNKHHVRRITKDDFLELKNGILIPVSIRKKEAVFKELLKA